jgi:hypothetical protein
MRNIHEAVAHLYENKFIFSPINILATVDNYEYHLFEPKDILILIKTL